MTSTLERDIAWSKSPLIPDWIRGREVGLDQHNTSPEVAKYCWQSLQDFLKKDGARLSRYKIIEPGAGMGSFYNLLPKSQRIGIDLEKYQPDYIQHDFLTWVPRLGDKPCIAIGNPPFGYRGWLALAFLNRAADYCEYVGFIVPMSFQSDGKGSPKHRVVGMKLVHSEQLPDDLFMSPDGETIRVNTLWQIWKKGEGAGVPDLSAANEYIDLFTVDKRKERLCGAEKMKTCKIFLQRTYFEHPPTIVNDFSKVKYVCGYGIVIKKDKRRVLEILKRIDWNRYSNLATHNCHHISMYHIRQALLDNL